MSRAGRKLLPEVAVLAVSVAVMTRSGRYLPHGVAVLARYRTNSKRTEAVHFFRN